MIWFSLLALFMYLVGVFGDPSVKPSNLPCKFDDNKCITGMLQYIYSTTILGIRELGIETSDPMYHELIEGKLPYLKYNLRNTKVEGFKNCKIKKVSVNSEKSSMRFEMMCPQVKMYGQYDIDGKLLDFVIAGRGDYSLNTTKYHMTMDMQMGFYKKDGITYLVHKNFNFTANLLGEFDLEIKPLFSGNKELADQIAKFGKENSRLYSGLLQDPIIRANVKKLIKNFNKRYRVVPANELVQLNDFYKTSYED